MAPKFQSALSSQAVAEPVYFHRHLKKHWSNALPRSIHVIGCQKAGALNSWGSEWKICASDPSVEVLNRARLENHQAEFRQGRGHVIPLFNHPFGVVVVLEGLETSAARSLREQLVPGGIFTAEVILSKSQDKDFWLDWTRTHFALLHWEFIPRWKFFPFFSNRILLVARKR